MLIKSYYGIKMLRFYKIDMYNWYGHIFFYHFSWYIIYILLFASIFSTAVISDIYEWETYRVFVFLGHREKRRQHYILIATAAYLQKCSHYATKILYTVQFLKLSDTRSHFAVFRIFLVPSFPTEPARLPLSSKARIHNLERYANDPKSWI